MIKIRTKMQPHLVKTYSNRRAIQDLLAWGLVLEVIHDDESPVLANDAGSVLPDGFDVAVNETDEPEQVLTLEQLELLNETSSDDFPFEDERE